MAYTVLSLPTMNTRVFGPCGPFTVATSGAVSVDRTSSLGAVESWDFHFNSRCETFSLVSVVSDWFQPLRC